MLTRIGGALLAAASLAGTAEAQLALQDDIVDRVIAIVGDSAILQTQIDEEIQRMVLGGLDVPPPSDPAYREFYGTVLDNWVDRLLVIQAAAQDSLIQPDEPAIDQQVADRIEELSLQFGGQPALVEALAAEGWTLAEYRDYMRQDARQLQVYQMYLQRALAGARPVEVSEAEMLARFEEASGQLQQRPRLLTIRQVVLKPEPAEEARERARQETEALLERVHAGEDFGDLAREHSDDVGTAEMGGDVGWFRRGQMVPEFEEAAFGLPAGSVSNPVETEFGFHIIKVERVRGRSEVQARHILTMPALGETDVERTRDLARQVYERARGGESMVELFDAYSDPLAPDSITVAFEQLDDFPPAYAALRSAVTGETYGPLEYQAATGRPTDVRFAVVKVEGIREAGAYTFDDLRQQLASQIQQEKQRDRLLEGLRARTHIEIRM